MSVVGLLALYLALFGVIGARIYGGRTDLILVFVGQMTALAIGTVALLAAGSWLWLFFSHQLASLPLDRQHDLSRRAALSGLLALGGVGGWIGLEWAKRRLER